MSVNLQRLADALNAQDILASALGIAEQNLVKIIQGRDGMADYLPHLEQRLGEAGFPRGWLNQTDAPVRPDFVNALHRMASSSVNLAPTRRRNFQSLVAAFEGRVDLLADALDLVEASVHGIANGNLVLDEERLNHLNPKLIEAGFPPDWLDAPAAAIDRNWVVKLQSLAEEEQLRIEAEIEESRAQAAARRAASEASAPPAAPAELSESAVPTEPTLESREGSVPAGQASPAAAELLVAADTRQAGLFDAPSPAAPVPSGRTISLSTSAIKPTALASQPSVLKPPKEQLPMSTAPSMKTAPTHPFASRGASKESAGVSLPRGVLGAGKQARPTPPSAPAASTATTPKAGRTHILPKKVAAAPKVEAVAPKVAAPSVPSHRAGKAPITREQSLARAAALEEILNTSRRGAKVTLWRELLDSSLPYWGNIRRGTVMLRDDMADAITKHMGLPDGWLDHPEFPPKTLASWVNDANVPLPVGAGTKSSSQEDGAGSEEHTPAAATQQAPAAIPAAAPVAAAVAGAARSPVTKPARGTTAKTIAPFAGQKQAAPATISMPTAAAQPAPAPAPVQAPATEVSLTISPAAHAAAAPVAVAGQGTFVWVPAQNGQLASPGPLVQALNLVLNQQSLAGRFSEEHALQLITVLTMTR